MTDQLESKSHGDVSAEPVNPAAPLRRLRPGLIVALAAYIGAVVTANVVTARMGLVPVGFGLLVPAGTYAAGAALLARDFVHRQGGRWWSLGAIGVAAILSWFLSTPEIATASVAAFVIAELVDLGIFATVRRRGFIRAAFTSNLVSAPLDTVVFLTLAGFPLTVETLLGQMVGKLVWATALPLAIYALVRWIRERGQSV
ncbi:VUT family protein [Cellulosimicrobium cellulans]|uniref:VUT family protein n=1 Tax=Cellulosimicrobium cellulans TaxID=1710 RepID=UPI0028A86BF0|nr:VUT family protein [Cellulosimicrobium cellulans]